MTPDFLPNKTFPDTKAVAQDLYKGKGFSSRQGVMNVSLLPTPKQASDQWKTFGAATSFLLLLAAEEAISDASKTQAAE
jgi:hypothetical protein